MKHMLLQGSVVVETVVSPCARHLTFRVSDTGPGLSESQLQKFNGPLTGVGCDLRAEVAVGVLIAIEGGVTIPQ